MKNATLIFLLILAIVGIGFWAVNNNGGQKTAVKIYFLRSGDVLPVERNVSAKEDLEKIAVQELLNGPTTKEKEAGYFSQIPKHTRLIKVYREDNIAKVDFSKDLGKYGGGTETVQGIIAQIVYTLTEFQGISKAQILIEGKSVSALGSEGFVLDKPLSRKDVSK